jgi:hypothetical protein
MSPQTKPVPIKDLTLDLGNFRTVKQANERSAIETMISTSPDRFWALTESLLDDGYLPTESVIVLRAGARNLTVKEGNRRVAALKLIHKMQPLSGLDVPDEIANRIKAVTAAWRRDNASVPCTIYDVGDAATVDKIVTLAHGKGEKAGRDQWNAVARARHNRDINGGTESALDLLEKYLQHGKNITPTQKGRWSGAFPLSVLAEAMKRLAPRLGFTTATVMAGHYPNVTHRGALESIVHDIGLEQLGFDRLRNKGVDFAVSYGLPAVKSTGGAATGKASGHDTGKKSAANKSAAAAATQRKQAAAQKALATGDPRAVKRLLQDFTPSGKKRDKLVSLKEEIVTLDLTRTPLAFSFVLRSMFELSAKAYCADHAASGGPPTTKANGDDRKLVEVLRDITNHLTKNDTDKAKKKELHGAITELAKSDGILSVTSMNQLVHNPRFSVAPADLAVVVANIFPLLEAMSS